MTCNHFRELASTRMDDELSEAESDALERHLQSCSDCRDFEKQAFALRRSLRISQVPDHEVVAADQLVLRALPSIRTASALQMLLLVIGATLLIVNLPSVVLPEATTAAHLDRHDGVFGSALGIAMVAVALKPQRAIGLVPLTSAIAVLMVAVAIADLAANRASLVSEAVHVVEFAGLVCLWVISGGLSRLRTRTHVVLGSLRRPTVPSWPTS